MKFHSINLDDEGIVGFRIPDLSALLAQEDFLHKKYIGLFAELPSDTHPGREIDGAGYQRQYFEPMAPRQRIEWSATGDWGKIAGFGVFNRHGATRSGVPGSSQHDQSLLLYIPTTFKMAVNRGEHLIAQYSDMQASLKNGKLPAHKTREPNFDMKDPYFP